MKRTPFFAALLPVLLGSAVAQEQPAAQYVPRRTGFDFPIYTNKPAGKQMGGAHTAAASPALSPEEAQRRFTVPEGFEVRLFAAEPEVVNPVAMTWDARGRLWVVELYEYPLGAAKGEKPRDRIKIFEDTDNDGRADKITVFADELNLATGILLGDGGAYVGQAPHLLFLRDTNGDDVADTREVVMTGFGLEDRHELLNGFTWGPDGWLYMTHGVFTHSKVRQPGAPADAGVVMNAAVARWHPRTKKFEVFADGTSNPWGVDFDRYGNAFVSACVIDHLFHMAPGGQYVRQSGVWANPYGYADMHSQRGGLPSIVDHRHFRAAFAGVQVYQGNQYPAEYLGTIFMGNIHDSSVHQDLLIPNGSTFKANHIKDFVRANDGWFRPVSQQIGPDGALWIMDWYDKYPCYQNARADPEGVDREHGRIWRVVYTGKEKGRAVPSRPQRNMDLGKLNGGELVGLLSHPNIWHRRMAQQLLTERGDAAVKPSLLRLLAEGQNLEARLFALWTLHSAGLLDEATLDKYVTDKQEGIRMWVARFSGERGKPSPAVLARLGKLASDPEPSVRLAVATALRQFTSGSLTVNTPPMVNSADADLGPVFTAVIKASADGKDTTIPFLIWMAAEPLVASGPEGAFNWLTEHGPSTQPLSLQLTTKTLRRIAELRQPALLDHALAFIDSMTPEKPALAAAALDGLLDGQKGKAMVPATDPGKVLGKLLASMHEPVKDRAQRLGTLWGDAGAIQRSVDQVNDETLPMRDRSQAIAVVRKLKNEPARNAMLTLVSRPNPEPLVIDAIRALGEIGGDDVAGELLKRWNEFTPAIRRAIADILVSRQRWASSFLSVIESKEIPASDIPVTAIRTLSQSKDDYGMLARRAAAVFGRVREADMDKNRIIAEKKKMILTAKNPPDLKAGHEVARRACFTCHKLHGEGADVGPDLTGVGRSSLDALLANTIDPNQVIGAGYENVEIETKDGRVVSGRMVENSDVRVRLLAAGPKEEVVAKSDIESMRVSEISVMPEGLEQMPDEDFRNMIAYILNPPQDNKPFSWLDENAPAQPQPAKPRAHSNYPQVDWESVSHWNPEWRVVAAEFEGTPVRHVDFAGRNNVLMTHPQSRDKASMLEREMEVPAARKTTLSFFVAAHDQGDWELRVLVDGKVLKREVVDAKGERWKPVSVDLTPFAGKKIKLSLENHAHGWSWEFAYWSGIQIASRD